MNLDYAMLVKLYGENAEAEKPYSPAQCIGCKRTVVIGDPDPAHVSTSFAERQNLSSHTARHASNGRWRDGSVVGSERLVALWEAEERRSKEGRSKERRKDAAADTISPHAQKIYRIRKRSEQ